MSTSNAQRSMARPLSKVDLAIYDLIQKETRRQDGQIELIASENFTSEAVLEATGSIFTNKYAEGYPGKRYYGGCEYADEVENLARDGAMNWALNNIGKRNARLLPAAIACAERVRRQDSSAARWIAPDASREFRLKFG